MQLREKVEGFVGSIMNYHGIKKGGLEQLAQPLKQVQVDDQSTHPSIHQSFVASGRCIEPDAPAVDGKSRWWWKGKQVETLRTRV